MSIIYFTFSIFLSAFLLFQVEPMIAKIILPWFGGTSAVWSAVVLFFQILLTGGYAYSYWILKKARRREYVHLVLLGVSLLLMLFLGLMWKSPVTPSANWKPTESAAPIWAIFRILFVSVGLPYFLLSANSPLIQAWFDRTYPQKTAYRLYALSNIGSLLGLVTYPVLIETTFSLTWQGRLWSLAYVLYAVLAGYGTIRSLRSRTNNDSSIKAQPEQVRPSATHYALWIALAAIASVLLLAVTSEITQEVAVIPFLWVLPLTIYLITFVMAFSGERWYSRQLFLLLLFAATLLAAWALGRSENLNIVVQIGIYSILLFAACMVCHGELYRLRPHPSRLTSFYLMVSIGGALGGLLINFVAPLVFKGFWEFPLGLALCWLVFLIVTFVSRPTLRHRWVFIVNEALLTSAVLISFARAYQQIHADLIHDVFIERNFYGVLRVRESTVNEVTPIHLNSTGMDLLSYHKFELVHGITVHGLQFHDEELRDLPTAYFGKTSGAGLAILNHPKRGKGMRVGILGLGVGTLAVYGQPGDVYRFYEINPAVIQLAQGENNYFTYLADSRAKVDIVPGDARLSLEEELGSGQKQDYDVLVLDVFSSDSIPVHLLDEESFEDYSQDLDSEGILAIHISNRHLDLIPVVWTLADHFGLARDLIADPGDGVATYESEWMLLARDPKLLANPAISAHAQSMLGYTPHVRLWTDDYNNLIQILR